MPAPDAVAGVAVSRAEVRKSLNRLEYHLNRGVKGARGVRREIAYIDALHRQTVRLSGLATGQPYTTNPLTSFGNKAAASLNSGNTRTIGRIKSSILADYSSDGLQPARDWTLVGGREWIWVANASACPTCLSKHGRAYKGPFVPSHPSCLCIPETPAQATSNGVTQLSGETVGEQLLNYGDPRYYGKARELKNGTLNLGDVQNIENINGQARGRAAWEAHMRKQEVYRADGAPPIAGAAPAPAPTPAPTGGGTAARVKDPHPPIDLDDFDAKLLRSLLDDGLDPSYDLTAIRQQILDRLAALGEESISNFKAVTGYTDDLIGKASKKMRKGDEATFRKAMEIAEEYIDNLPPAAQLKYREALAEILTFRPEVLSKIPASGRMTLGHWAPRAKIPRRGIVNKELMIQFKRVDDEAFDTWNKAFTVWKDANNKAFNDALDIIKSGPTPNKFGPAHDAARAHRLANPAPVKPKSFLRNATAEEVSSTLVHELTHVVDSIGGQAIRKQAVNMYAKVTKYFEDGVEEFWYAASRSKYGQPMYGETVAELGRFYIEGWPKSGVSAAQWRAKYPELAQWVEEVIYA